MPAKTDVKKKVLILGTGPDAEEARQIAEDHADVTITSRFTANVTHLVVDETVKQSEPRLKRASSESVPVLRLGAFKELLGAAADEEKTEDATVPEQAEAPEVEQDSAAEVEDEAEKAADETADEGKSDESAEADAKPADDKADDKAEAKADKKADDKPAKAEEKPAKAEEKKTKSEESDDDASGKAVDESKPVGGSTKTEAAPKVGFLAKLKAMFGKK